MVRWFQGLDVRMLFYYVDMLSFSFYQRRFTDILFYIFRSSSVRRYFHVLSFCLSEGCFIIFMCSLSVFMKDVLWIFWFTFSGVQVSEFVCQRLSVERFRCQTVILFV